MDKGNTGQLVCSKTKWTDFRYRHRVRRLSSKTRTSGNTQPLVEGAIHAITFSVPVPAELPEEFQA